MTTCCDIYRSPWVGLLLGEVRHPGGLALTRALAEGLGLGPDDVVLDLGCGSGASAAFVARTFGCRVLALDGAGVPDPTRPTGGVRLVAGDALALPLGAHALDAILCECTLSLLGDKRVALREMARVLRPGGRLGLSDMVVSGPLPAELQGPWAQAACLAGATDLDGYAAALTTVGFRILHTGQHPDALLTLVDDVGAKLRLGEMLIRIGKLDVSLDWARIQNWVRVARETIRAGTIGYATLVAERA